jgi:hypothetical protein
MVVYAFLNARRERLGEVVEPEEPSAVHDPTSPARADLVGRAKEVA